MGEKKRDLREKGGGEKTNGRKEKNKFQGTVKERFSNYSTGGESWRMKEGKEWKKRKQQILRDFNREIYFQIYQQLAKLEVR